MTHSFRYEAVKLITLATAAAILLGLTSARSADWTAGDDCVSPTQNDINVELKSGIHPPGPTILSDTYFLQAGTAIDVILKKPFKEGQHYFVYVERYHDETIHEFIPKGLVSWSQAPESNSLVKRGLADKLDTLITLRISDSIAGFWQRANLYIYTCAANRPDSVSRLTAPISPWFYSGLVVLLAISFVYSMAAFASRSVDVKTVHWFRYFDPVFLTAGADGKGSLSKLQILFFSLIVFGLTTYIVLRAGILSDISPTILMLLGIAGVGSVAAKGADLGRNRIDFENWAWFIRKTWLPPGGLAEVNRASWYDIFTSDGEFDIYRYQSFIFSLAVGVSLLVSGVNQLASFTIPETVLGLLGLSQVVYVSGKLTQTSISDLNSATKELRSLESKFIDAAFTTPDPNPPAGSLPLAPPSDLAAAIRRAGRSLYDDYLKKAKSVSMLFRSVTGREVNAAAIEPSITP